MISTNMHGGKEIIGKENAGVIESFWCLNSNLKGILTGLLLAVDAGLTNHEMVMLAVG